METNQEYIDLDCYDVPYERFKTLIFRRKCNALARADESRLRHLTDVASDYRLIKRCSLNPQQATT